VGDTEYWFVVTRPDGALGINGGILKRRGPAPTESTPVNAYICTVDVPDIDATIERITASGGTLALEKTKMPGVGWLAYYKDTEGNIFGVNQQEGPAHV
jgi:predicted enzyme related to lactoylglutathione lyase